MGRGKRQLESQGEAPEHPKLLLVGSQVHTAHPGLAHESHTGLGTIPTLPLGFAPLKWCLLSSTPQPHSQQKALDNHPSSNSDWAVELRPHSPSSRRTNPEFTKLNPSSISKQPLSFMIPKHQWRGFNHLVSLLSNLELQDNFLFFIPPASLKRTSEPNGPAYQEILMHLNKKAIKHFNKVRGGAGRKQSELGMTLKSSTIVESSESSWQVCVMISASTHPSESSGALLGTKPSPNPLTLPVPCWLLTGTLCPSFGSEKSQASAQIMLSWAAKLVHRPPMSPEGPNSHPPHVLMTINACTSTVL